MSKSTIPLYIQVAQKLIEELKKGTVPWRKPWNGDGVPLFSMPYNQQSGQRYKGINAINLLMMGYEDPRWLTFKQAEGAGFKVNHKEHGTLIQFVKTHQQKSLSDNKGNKLYDELGNPLTDLVLLKTPIISNAWVFNAQQMSGLPSLSLSSGDNISWDPLVRAETLISASGAKIEHQFIDRAYYHPRYDIITMPDRSQFDSSSGYYATLLHELSHWTGHPDRLDRSVLMENGAEAYAREELRAEIASMLLGNELHIGYDISQHISYLDSWVSILENSPFEIHSAAADAEKILAYLSAIEQKRDELIHQEAIDTHLQGNIQPGSLKYLSTGDEISYKGNIYQIQGHLKQGRLRVQQSPAGIVFTLSKTDQLYRSLSEIKQSLNPTIRQNGDPQLEIPSKNQIIKR